MFLLSLFGKTKPYTSKELAEKNAAHWLRKHVLDNHWLWTVGVTSIFRTQFENAMRQENYHTCVEVWNKYAIEHYYGDSARRVIIEEVKVDDIF